MTRHETAGARLRREVREKFDLDPAELLLLDRAAAMADVLERLEAELACAPLATTGSRGQRVAEPLLREVRECSGRLESLLAALQLPGRDEDVGRSRASRSARHAAQVRWTRKEA